MSGTVTTHELDNLLGALANATRTVGANPEGLTIQHGSKTYGRAFRLFCHDPKTGGLSDVPALRSSYLGMTKTEAASALRFLTDGLRIATAARNGCTVTA